MPKYKVLITGVKIDDGDDTSVVTNVDLEAVGVFTNGEWVTFHESHENFTNNVIAAIPTARVVLIQRDDS